MRAKERIWENNDFILEVKVNLTKQNNNLFNSKDHSNIDRERQQLAEEGRRLEKHKRQLEQAKASQKISPVTHIKPITDDSFLIEIKQIPIACWWVDNTSPRLQFLHTRV